MSETKVENDKSHIFLRVFRYLESIPPFSTLQNMVVIAMGRIINIFKKNDEALKPEPFEIRRWDN